MRLKCNPTDTEDNLHADNDYSKFSAAWIDSSSLTIAEMLLNLPF